MQQKTTRALKLILVLACFLPPLGHAKETGEQAALKDVVDRAILPLKQRFNVPGMAVAVTIDGKRHFFNYGVMSKETRKPVTNDTLFEIGSISKTFAATLAAYAHVNGNLSVSDSVSKHLPALRGSSFDKTTLLNLGTHTSGLPLFVPDEMTGTDQLMSYLNSWTPTHPAGARRVYSNIGTGLLGMIAAQSMQMPYEKAVEDKLFRPLGMTRSFFNIPPSKTNAYAQGYTTKDLPVRLNSGLLGAQSYGVKTSTSDLIRFVEANLHAATAGTSLQRAIAATHTGYFKAGAFVQGLMWEQYGYPTGLDVLLAGNASTMAFQPADATELEPPLPPRADVRINKTGSTNGFAAYAAFVPSRRIGIVILANKNYPVDQRVSAAHQILAKLDK